MSILASIYVPVAHDRPIDSLLRSLFDQSAKSLEILVASDRPRDDAIRLGLEVGHDLPISNLAVPLSPPGRALNLAAQLAEGHYLVTLSAQARIPDDGWLFRLLAPFLDPRIAAVSGADLDLDRLSIQDPWYLLTLADFLCAPEFGASCLNSAFLRELVLRHPFDEGLESCCDKEWTYRILSSGHRVRMDYEARVHLPAAEDDEAALRDLWRSHQAIASFLRLTDRARLLWEWAWKQGDPLDILKAITLGHRLRRQRFLDPNLPDAMEARGRFKKGSDQLARPARF